MNRFKYNKSSFYGSINNDDVKGYDINDNESLSKGDLSIPIFIIHGISGKIKSLEPLVDHLSKSGFNKVTILKYPIDDDFADSINHIDKELEKHTDRFTDIILIGQSYGGVISNRLHTKGWRIKKAFYIVSPLNGSRLCRTFSNLIYKLPNFMIEHIIDRYYRKSHKHLRDRHTNFPPPHDYMTISTGISMDKNFDGQVYKEETILEKNKHIHIPRSNHWFLFFDKRLL